MLIRLFVKKMYYIKNNFVLPEPLNDKDELECLLLVQEGNLEARNKLIEHNMRLVVFIAKRFETPKAQLEDLVSIGSMGLIKGINTFKLDKNIKLATYASRCIENEILMFLRKMQKMKGELSLDETLNVDSDGNELLLQDILGSDDFFFDELLEDERKKFMYACIEKLSKREKEIMVLRYGLYNNNSMTQKEVAVYLGISQSYISRLEKKIIDNIKEEILSKITF